MTRRPPLTATARALLAWLPAAAWASVIFAGSSVSGSSIPGDFSVIGHLSEYAVLGALVCFALRGLSPRRVIGIALLVCALYGASDELHQAFVPLRSPDPLDWATDMVGAASGASMYLVIRAWAARRRPMHQER
jgi:VanZ family protein